MKTNVAIKKPQPVTHEGGKASRITAEQELRRTVCACMLFEDSFYENGVSAADRIASLVKQVKPEKVRELAVKARTDMKLRHVPLQLLASLAQNGGLNWRTVEQVIQRPDELAELIAIYWKGGKKPLKQAMKKGLAAAFRKFNEYSLAKYNQDGEIKLRDVLFLCHAKPKDAEQAALWKRLIDGKLEIPDTWEVSLSESGGQNKKEIWTRLLQEQKLGALAVIRNLRNMLQAGVNEEQIRQAIRSMKTDRVLPYRFIAAARFAPQFEPELEQAMISCMAGQEKMTGETIILVDVSGSMDDTLSGKSDMTRLDAACGLAILMREIGETVKVYTFSDGLVQVPARRGFALRDAIVHSQQHSSTQLGLAINALPASDRLIVITDEQSHDDISRAKAPLAYIVNVASYKNGVAYDKFVHVHGWSESVVDYIREYEKLA